MRICRLRMRLWAVALLLAANAPLRATAAAATKRPEHTELEPPHQAFCAIRFGDQALLVRDVWSRRYALPGGPVGDFEALDAAAARHARAATGLIIEARGQLGNLEDAAVFDCVAATPMSLLPDDVLLIPASARGATIEARLVNPTDLTPAQWRDAPQAQQTVAIWRRATVARASLAPPAAASGNALFAVELRGTRFLQAYVPQAWSQCMTALSLLGAELAFCIAIIVVWCTRGYRMGLEFSLYMMVICLVNCCCKQTFQLPRPCYLDPRLQLQHAASFGFPSGHTVGAASLALWAGYRALPARRSIHMALVAGVLGCSVSRVYLGVHFIHDVVGAWVESYVLYRFYAAALGRMQVACLPLSYWWGLLMGAFVATCFHQLEPGPVVFFCLGIGLLLGAALCRPAQMAMSWPWRIGLSIVMAIGFWAMHHLCASARPSNASFATCLQRTILSGLGQGLVMPVAYSIAERLHRLIAPPNGQMA